MVHGFRGGHVRFARSNSGCPLLLGDFLHDRPLRMLGTGGKRRLESEAELLCSVGNPAALRVPANSMTQIRPIKNYKQNPLDKQLFTLYIMVI